MLTQAFKTCWSFFKTALERLAYGICMHMKENVFFEALSVLNTQFFYFSSSSSITQALKCVSSLELICIDALSLSLI